MTLLETVASGQGFIPGRGPELLALSVLTLGPDGEMNGEPGTGRVPSLFANHGFQVGGWGCCCLCLLVVLVLRVGCCWWLCGWC